MTLFVNLSTTHDYSIEKTVAAFVQLCNEHSKGCLQGMPGFFQNWTNYAWVMAKYQLNYTSLIEPYKLGRISTEQFLKNLSKIFYFMDYLDEETRNSLLINAWNASIKLSTTTQDRLSQLVEEAITQPVYLISNTNELNVQAILALFKANNPDVPFNEAADIRVLDSQEPIEIARNIYLCLSYRHGAFKTETVSTVSLLDDVAKKCSGPKTLVSQYPGDLQKGVQLGLDRVLKAEDFYHPAIHDSSLKKGQ